MGLLDSDALVGLLGAADRDHALISNNLANVNTPGYKTLRMRFKAQLEALLDQQGRLLPGRTIETETYRPLFADVGADGNDVTLEREVAELNKNALKMRVYLAVLDARIQRLRAAIESR
jgi:flagellar basal-body rod protein FlgB